MDIILEVCNNVFLDRLWATVYPHPSPVQIQDASKYSEKLPWVTPSHFAERSAWDRDNVYRQCISLYLIVWLFGVLLYFIFSTLSYLFVFDHATFTHPKYLKNQVRLEIEQTMKSMPIMAIFTAPLFLLEIRGHGRLYESWSEAPFAAYNILQYPLFLAFTDMCIYWIHRGLHHPLLYKRLHKPHHKWIMPTPFASHAFHPLDGFSQSLPYHIFPLLFPLSKYAYVALFVFVNFWTILIHDGEYVANSFIVNGAACHTMHHLYFNYNYGQFTTIWDRIAGSYRRPNEELFARESKMSKQEWERQSKEVETVQKAVEGDDDRDYHDEASRLAKKMM